MANAESLNQKSNRENVFIEDIEHGEVLALSPLSKNHLDARRAIERHFERKALERNISEYWFD